MPVPPEAEETAARVEQPAPPGSIAGAVICLDEEVDLPGCLRSLAFCDDLVVVVDSRTRDRSAEIAREQGARVYVREWPGWTPQKNFAFGVAGGEWILSVDADERVSPELRDEILATIRRPDACNGYYVARRNYWLGKWLHHGGWYPDYTLRLFRKAVGECRYQVHERIEVQGATGVLRNDLLHYNIVDIDEHLRTMMRATGAEAQEMVHNGLRFYWIFPFGPFVSYLRHLFRGPVTRLHAYLLAKEVFKNRVQVVWWVPLLPLFRFLHIFVYKRGFLDGAHGFFMALLSAIYVMVKYAKYWELRQRR